MERMDQRTNSKRRRETTDLEQASYKRLHKEPVIDVVSMAGTKLQVMKRSASADDLASLQPHEKKYPQI